MRGGLSQSPIQDPRVQKLYKVKCQQGRNSTDFQVMYLYIPQRPHFITVMHGANFKAEFDALNIHIYKRRGRMLRSNLTYVMVLSLALLFGPN